MPAINEGQLTFQFPVNWEASKYDDWSFYLNQFQSVCGGAKAIYVLAHHRNDAPGLSKLRIIVYTLVQSLQNCR